MLLLTDFGSQTIRTFGELWSPVTGMSSTLAYLVHSGQFCMLLLSDFVYRGDTNIPVTSGSSYEELIKIRGFYTFWTIL